MPRPQEKPLHCIEVHVAQIDQLFNAIDPSPFHTRDLDPDAHDYIVKSAKALPPHGGFEMLVHLDQVPASPSKLQMLDQAVRAHFEASAQLRQAQLQDLFKRGRISLLIGLAFLSVSIGLSEWLALEADNPLRLWRVLKEGVVIGGWVAMWRPMEIFLYDWWPVAAQIRLLRRLANLKVRVRMRQSQPVGRL